ncbi:Amino acid permease [Gaiella occulta]|uniref:Amino acid permease n=1 Tax=Gaiella occulta TaxID=1002870 RepID=A0A7M2Z0B2_9ACTN|nr:APC family permease [Gaiella occulta]RDI75720.1 Amino acid permease [Gaiella occulta]
MSQADAGSAGPATGALGKRNLTTIHAVAQALAIGPMFSVALVLGGVSRPDIGAGWNAALAVLLAGLGVLAIAYTISLYARRYSGAGAVYEYLTHGAHPWVGVFTAGFFFAGALFLGGGGIYLGLGILSDGFWKSHISDGGPSWWVWGMIALGIVLVLNYIGVRIAIRAMLTFAAISFLPMLVLALVIIVKGGESGNTLSMFNPGETSLFGITGGGVLGGILLGILLFVGFEAAASIGEESENPHRSIPRALIWTVAVAAAFYVVMAYAISVGYGKEAVSKGAWAGSPGPVSELATKYIGSWYSTILELVIILDAMALALAICVMIGRGFFALGRDGLLPKVFAKTSRYDTPWVGNLMVAVGGIGLVILASVTSYSTKFGAIGPDGKFIQFFPTDAFATFIMSATVGSYAIELVYLILAVVAVRLVPKAGNHWWQYLIVLVAVATPLLGFYGALHPAPHDRSNVNWEALYWTIGLIVVSLVWFAIVLVSRRSNVDNAAAHAAEHHGVPPLDETLGFEPLPEGKMPL